MLRILVSFLGAVLFCVPIVGFVILVAMYPVVIILTFLLCMFLVVWWGIHDSM